MLSWTKRDRCKALLVRLGLNFDQNTLDYATQLDLNRWISMERRLRKGRRTGQQRKERNQARAAARQTKRK